MPPAPVVMLPQVPLFGAQPPASAKTMPWVPLASQASYGVTLPPQSLSAPSAPDERDSLLLEKQVRSRWPFSLSASVLVRTCSLVNCRSGSQIFKQSQKHLWRSARSQRCLQRSAGGMAARRRQEPAAWPSQDSRMALLLRSRHRMDALGSTMAAVVGALEMERIPATSTVSSLKQLCSRYSSDFKLLGKRKQSG